MTAALDSQHSRLEPAGGDTPPPPLPMVSPRGIPDRLMSRREARLWLVSQADRERGVEVAFDEDAQRWVVDRDAAVISAMSAKVQLRCSQCAEKFIARRRTAKYCGTGCQRAASRDRLANTAGLTQTPRTLKGAAA